MIPQEKSKQSVLRDMDEGMVRSDGTSELGRMVNLRVSEWVNSAAY